MSWYNKSVEVGSYQQVLYFAVLIDFKDHTKEIRLSEDRVPAFMLAEIAFLVTLSSADNNVSLTAAHCLRLLAEAERAPGAPQGKVLNEDERARRFTIYDQLGDPKFMVVGKIDQS